MKTRSGVSGLTFLSYDLDLERDLDLVRERDLDADLDLLGDGIAS